MDLPGRRRVLDQLDRARCGTPPCPASRRRSCRPRTPRCPPVRCPSGAPEVLDQCSGPRTRFWPCSAFVSASSSGFVPGSSTATRHRAPCAARTPAAERGSRSRRRRRAPRPSSARHCSGRRAPDVERKLRPGLVPKRGSASPSGPRRRHRRAGQRAQREHPGVLPRSSAWLCSSRCLAGARARCITQSAQAVVNAVGASPAVICATWARNSRSKSRCRGRASASVMATPRCDG
jgi:hypothetical protein